MCGWCLAYLYLNVLPVNLIGCLCCVGVQPAVVLHNAHMVIGVRERESVCVCVCVCVCVRSHLIMLRADSTSLSTAESSWST